MQKNMGVPWNKGHTPSSAHASILYSFHLDFPSLYPYAQTALSPCSWISNFFGTFQTSLEYQSLDQYQQNHLGAP